jgi:hypothetical protein
MTLYMKLGGRKTIMQAMPCLLSRLDQDPCFNLGRFRQEMGGSDDLTEFLVFLSGGAPFYDGRPICDLLSPICTDKEVYARFVDHLVAVLLGSRTETGDETELRQLMDKIRPHVLAPRPVAPVKVFSVEPELQGA